MRPRTLIITAATLCLFFAVPAGAEQPIKDPAALLPAETLAYAELRQPGMLLKEIADLFEDTALGNVPDSLVKLWGPKGQPPRGDAGRMGAMGLLFSPEMIREAGRVQGAAVALTGVKDGQPQGVVMILPGESNGPAFLMRAFLTVEGVKQIGEVKGVKIYQQMQHAATRPAERPAPREERTRPEEREDRGERKAERVSHEPAFAMLPGVLLIGTPDAVKDVIGRATGTVKGDSLADSKGYQETSKEIGGQPGPFAYVNLPAALDALEKGLAHLGKEERGAPMPALAAMKDLLGVKAFRAVAYSMSLEKGTFRYRELVLLDPKEKSPVLNLLPTEPVKKDLLHFTPADTVLVTAMSNAGGAERWAEIVKLLDGIAKLSGHGMVPSEEIDKVEKAIGIDFGKDVFGKISSFAFALGDPLKAPMKRVEEKGENFRRVHAHLEVPGVVVLQANDEEAATALLEKVLPKVYGAITRNADVKAETKKVAGQTIHMLPASESMGLHYGRSGRTIVLGAYPMPVAQAMNNGEKKKGWLSDEKVAARSKELEGTVYFMAMKPVTLAVSGWVPMFSGEEKRERTAPPAPREKPQAPPERATRQERTEESVKLPKELTQMLEKEELFVIRVTRKEGRILEEGTWPGLKAVVGQAMDLSMKWLTVAPKAAPAPERREPEDRRPR